MYPLSSLALLSTDVDHAELAVLQFELRFRYTNRSGAAVNNVFLVGLILWVEQPFKIRVEIWQAGIAKRSYGA